MCTHLLSSRNKDAMIKCPDKGNLGEQEFIWLTSPTYTSSLQWIHGDNILVTKEVNKNFCMQAIIQL